MIKRKEYRPIMGSELSDYGRNSIPMLRVKGLWSRQHLIGNLEFSKKILSENPQHAIIKMCMRFIKNHYERLENTTMAMNYDKLWKLLIDKKMNRTDLHEQAHVSTNAIATMGKGGDVSTKVLDKICKTLDCQIHDIIDYVPDKDDVQEN